MRVGEQHVALGKKTGELEIDEAGDLKDAAADEDRDEGGDDGGDMSGAEIDVAQQWAQIGVNGWSLHGELQHGSGDRGPGDGVGERDRALAAPSALPDESGDDDDVHHYAGGVGEKEAAMAVEHAEAPGGKDEQSGAGKDNAHESDGEGALFALESGNEQGNEQRSAEDSESDDEAGDQGEQGEDGFGEFAGLALASLGTEAGVNGNEGCGEHAFAQQILQHIGHAKGGAIGVGGERGSEIVGEETLADESTEAAEQNSGGNHGGRGFAPARLSELRRKAFPSWL